ncbi:cyclic nucleotide-binding domain-containing protein [Hoeflea sp. WL0058]|uniref:Cyclic nucleotide-binding domain-containing protein n=2 Tax=Flavimaribacter sediminis TaxID=2865987 RepID=A0AAE2ZH48_9HYPH|nr:cyclic nucleotide-binding domain-containing protein [Flavimaribacter sediminis]
MTEGHRSDRLFVLAEGALEVYRGDVSIAMVTEPGSVFGEMSILLDVDHTANVRAATDAKVHIVDGAKRFIEDNPSFLLPIAHLLAMRLNNSTAYLVDLKRQFQDYKDHFGMVDEVLESLAHEQEEQFMPDDELPDDT